MWCVIQVVSGEEMQVKEQLETNNYKAYVPRENRLIRSKGSFIQKEYVLFPGYIFLDIDYSAKNYYRIKEISGVIKFLGEALRSDTLSPVEIEFIKVLINNGNAIKPLKIILDSQGDIVDITGVAGVLRNRLKKIDKHSKKAEFEITLCGEVKKIKLSAEIAYYIKKAEE